MFVIEPVESRRLLSTVTLLATGGGDGGTTVIHEDTAQLGKIAKVTRTGTLEVTGTSAADRIAITQVTGGMNVKISKFTTFFVTGNNIKRITVQGKAGKDVVAANVKENVKVRLVGGKGTDQLFFVLHGASKGGALTQAVGSSSSWFTELSASGNDTPSPASADGLKLTAPISGTTSQGFVALLPTDLGGKTVLQAEKNVTIPTRADNPQIKFGTFPASTVNDWFSKDVNLFAPGHGVGLVVRVEADSSATSYKYDSSTDDATVSERSTDGIFFSSSTVANGKGGFTQKTDTVYVEDVKGTKTWKLDTPAEIAEAKKNALPSNGFIVDGGASAPDPYQIANGDGSKEKLALPGIAAADTLATMLVNSNAVKGDLSTIASGTTLTAAQAKAYFDAKVQPYLDVYTPSAKQAGHRELVVETPSYNGRQTRLVTNDDGSVTVTQIDASPLRLVEGVDAGSKAIVGTMFSKYEA